MSFSYWNALKTFKFLICDLNTIEKKLSSLKIIKVGSTWLAQLKEDATPGLGNISLSPMSGSEITEKLIIINKL